MSSPERIDFDTVRGGPEALLRLVPRIPAVYAWFNKFYPPDPDSSTGEDFAAYLEAEIRRPHMMPRETRLPPVYSLLLTSDRALSEGKREDLASLCRARSFRRQVAALLREHASIFAQPLYVGRATVLRDRVGQHLSPDSDLRTRLQAARIDIARCRLVYVDLSDVGEEFDDSDAVPDVIEELLSKLFCPPFTARYG
jgi:hypothetical protein